MCMPTLNLIDIHAFARIYVFLLVFNRLRRRRRNAPSSELCYDMQHNKRTHMSTRILSNCVPTLRCDTVPHLVGIYFRLLKQCTQRWLARGSDIKHSGSKTLTLVRKI